MTAFVTAERAVEAIKTDDDVVLANFCGEPRYLPMALMNRARELSNVRVFHMAVHGPFQEKYTEPGMHEHIRCATPFCGRSQSVRHMVKSGNADFFPVTFAGVPRLLREGEFKSDVFMLTVSPPDERGYCSLGVSVDYAWGAIDRPTRTIIAEINPHMPHTNGKTSLHVSRIDFAVEVDEPLFELPQSPITDVEATIGKNVAELVKNGSTLQIGFGSTSESVLYFLKDKSSLGIHTEMAPEGMRDLFIAGAVTNGEKSLHPGKAVCTFHGGTAKLYDWLDGNSAFEMLPVDYTNDPRVIAMNRNLVAINAALQVDLYGNVYADMLGLDDHYTGAGGQLDFAAGCSLAADSKFINVLQSTTRDGKHSRIVAHPTFERANKLAPQMPTVPRYYSDYIVTEFGVARLKGRSNSERARDLISVAHPNFRDILRAQARKLGLI